ncbi:methyltransferase domain-containing protein [Candidatus Microgenomates bacterium]|nr:methyltransferase domain-containing protein [Candidatus Microgenomates bacterium]
MTQEELKVRQFDSDPFGLRGFDFSVRVPEKSEIFDEGEARAYIEGCDYPESADDLLLALEVQRMFGQDSIGRIRILDAMCGPGRLGREFLGLGVQSVWFHDGDEIMTSHAKEEALKVLNDGQTINVITSPVESIPVPDNSFDLVICHNATHQMASIDRLGMVMREFLRITVPLGHIVIADYQRSTTPNFIRASEERLQFTRPEIVPLLIPSFTAAFSKGEFGSVVCSIPGIRKFLVTDAEPPTLTQKKWERVDADFVKGHIMDYGPISLRVIIQKEEL